MKSTIEKCQLYKWLKSKDESVAFRVLQIREELAKWLPHIAQLFPHYPSHGVDHSDRIVDQLSKLLFKNSKPVVRFSTAEVYCLLCAAYLHDMGMVVSPGEVSEILKSETWNEFVADGGKGHFVYQQYVELRDGPIVETKELTSFLGDQSFRYLLADFVRRDHHERGKITLELHPFLRKLVDDGDSVAFETISDIGVAHGLRDCDLGDKNRFPEERDVFDGKVNVRFLARLLRIGDLLDMSSRRADPISARAIGPLPRDAVPHWQQYSAKKHENISPTIIEFTFDCQDQDAHRVLRDWFGWLESEVRSVGFEQLHARRHGEWKAPRCAVSSHATADSQVGTDEPTITIRPAKKANYTFHDWKLEFDQELVLQRLIHDVYNNPTIFLRELIQNALDATRCQMYFDFEAQHHGVTPPDRPTQFVSEYRERYPLCISFTRENVELSPDGPTESRPVITIEDRGTGMDEEIIRRYFLQIGRSYYQSNEFRERYKFAPTSRFGVGFLSVFAVSQDITVETARRNEDTGVVTGIRLRLREPRHFLLTERWNHFSERTSGSKTGTRIRVVLNDWSLQQSLAELVRYWCVAVEFPVVVNEAGVETIVRPDLLKDKTVLAIGRVDQDARFVLRTFAIDSYGVEGQVAVIAYQDEAGEGWCECWPPDKDLGGKPLESLPKLEQGYTALHGVRLGEPPVQKGRSYKHTQWLLLCDVRSPSAAVSLGRVESMNPPHFTGRSRRGAHGSFGAISLASTAVENTARVAVERHLTDSPRARAIRGIYYKGRVLSGAPLPDAWRDEFPCTVVTWQRGRRVDISVKELLALNEFIIPAWMDPYRMSSGHPDRHPTETELNAPIVSWSDTPSFSDDRFRQKIGLMNLIDVTSIDGLWLFHFSTAQTNPLFYRAHEQSNSWVIPAMLHGVAALHCEFLRLTNSDFYILSQDHNIVQWLSLLRESSKKVSSAVNSEHVEGAWHAAATKWYEMRDLLQRWDDAVSIPQELKPPRDTKNRLLDFTIAKLYSKATVPLKSP